MNTTNHLIVRTFSARLLSGASSASGSCQVVFRIVPRSFRRAKRPRCLGHISLTLSEERLRFTRLSCQKRYPLGSGGRDTKA